MTNKDDIAEIKFKKLRHCIGLLGLALPMLIVLHAKIFDHCNCLQDSISHYYYTVSISWFVGILWALGLVLIFYPTPPNGSMTINACSWKICKVFKPKLDGTLTSISGVFAICVALIPTNANSHDSCAVFYYQDNAWRAGIHYFSAASMLLIFSYISICIFTRTNDKNWRMNKWKVLRNKIYICCGTLTFISILVVAILAIIDRFTDIPVYNKSTYCLEVCALFPFGISWLVKGGFILTDEGEASTVAKVKNLVTKGKLI